jgi:hypothetical protein
MNDDLRELLLSRRGPACISSYALDRMRLGELGGTREGDALSAHLRTCSHCRDRLDELAAVRAPALDVQRLTSAGKASPARAMPARPWRWRLASLGGLFLCTATAVVLLLAPWRGDRERSKGGGWQLGPIVQHPSGRVERVSAGATLAPGDRLRFEVVAPHDAFVSVVSLDARGQVTAFVPAQGKALPIKAGRRRLLVGAVLLDDALGPERLLLAACAQEIAVADVVASARAELARVGGSITDVGTLPLPCQQTSFWFRKEKRP